MQMGKEFVDAFLSNYTEGQDVAIIVTTAEHKPGDKITGVKGLWLSEKINRDGLTLSVSPDDVTLRVLGLSDAVSWVSINEYALAASDKLGMLDIPNTHAYLVCADLPEQQTQKPHLVQMQSCTVLEDAELIHNFDEGD